MGNRQTGHQLQYAVCVVAVTVGEDQCIQSGAAHGLKLVGCQIPGIAEIVSAAVYQQSLAPGKEQSGSTLPYIQSSHGKRIAV